MTIDAAIIGGGISGLVAAYELKRQGYQVAVLERQQRAGGNAVSERFDGFLMEHGPSTVNATSDAAIDLSREFGLEAARCGLGDGVRRRYLVGGGKLCGIPTHPLGFLVSGYLSPLGKLRLMAEFAVSRCPHENEETVWDFCTRRFGREFTERVLDPLTGGVYAGRASELSMPAVFPKLIDMEKMYGSITAGIVRRRWRGGQMPGSRLFSWRDGIGTLPKALTRYLGQAVHTGVTVQNLKPLAGGYR
ncbi:MAG: protoporphyrinogen oxidase, partial [Methyloligellaceae bacterium]